MRIMTAKRPKGGGKGKGDGDKAPRPGRPFGLRINEILATAFDDYIESTEPRPTQTSAFEVALREFLEKRGFWPPRKKED